MRTAGSRKCYCKEGFKQEATWKGSLIEGVRSKDSLLNSDKGEAIQAEALQVKYEIMRQQSYLDQNIKLKLGPARGPEANLHNLFDLKRANDIPIMKYFEMDVAFLGPRVPKVRFLVVKDPSHLLQTKKKTKLPGIIRWNLIRLAYKKFLKKYL